MNLKVLSPSVKRPTVSDQTTGAQLVSADTLPCEKAELSRRRFFTRLTVAAGSAIGALAGLPVIGFVLGPLVRPAAARWRPVGALDSFTVGQTVKVEFSDPSSLPWSGITAKTAAWLRRTGENEFIAFSINCRHLGCPVRWLEGARLFMCPCHGGVYYEDGSVAAGPPPRATSPLCSARQ